jgi:hypothetical protein
MEYKDYMDPQKWGSKKAKVAEELAKRKPQAEVITPKPVVEEEKPEPKKPRAKKEDQE